MSVVWWGICELDFPSAVWLVVLMVDVRVDWSDDMMALQSFLWGVMWVVWWVVSKDV